MRPTVEIAVPVHNEEAALERSVRRLHDFCAAHLPYSVRIVIADNASEDGTRAIGERLAGELDAVIYLRLSEKGRGRALRRVWSRSEADVVAYMDVDLSTRWVFTVDAAEDESRDPGGGDARERPGGRQEPAIDQPLHQLVVHCRPFPLVSEG
jgi:glycosyltransferase involved in cell wall biosynthesis